MHNYNYHEWPTRPLWYFYVSTEKSQQVTDPQCLPHWWLAIILSARLVGREDLPKNKGRDVDFCGHLCISLGDGFNDFLCLLLRGNFPIWRIFFNWVETTPLDPSWSYLILCSKVRTFMKMVQANVPVMVKYKSRTQPESEVSMAVCRCAWDNFTL